MGSITSFSPECAWLAAYDTPNASSPNLAKGMGRSNLSIYTLGTRKQNTFLVGRIGAFRSVSCPYEPARQT
jgi:hypothetical protein